MRDALRLDKMQMCNTDTENQKQKRILNVAYDGEWENNSYAIEILTIIIVDLRVPWVPRVPRVQSELQNALDSYLSN